MWKEFDVIFYQQQVRKLEKQNLDNSADLQKLKLKAKNGENGEDDDEQDAKPKLKLRNYKPHDSAFKKATTTIPEKPVKISSQIKDQLIENDEKDDEIGIETLQPRKPDWDLKRDLNPKMKKLNKRTHKVLTMMLKERLASEEAMSGDRKRKNLEKDGEDSAVPVGESDRYKDMLPNKSVGTKFR